MTGLSETGEGKAGGAVYPTFGYRRRVGFSAIVVVLPAAIIAGFIGGFGSSSGQFVGIVFGIAVAPMLGMAAVVGLAAVAARSLGLHLTAGVAAILGAAIGTACLALLGHFALALMLGAVPGAIIGLVWSDPAALSEG